MSAVPSPPWGLRGVGVAFGAVKALDGVTLEVEAGRVTTVVGGDGAGKSTLLRTLARIIVPQTGSVSAPARREIGLLPATAGSWQNLTVRQNLRFAADVAATGDKGRLQELLRAAGLEAAADRLASQLSGGMRRKLGVIMALVAEPRLLLLDEPTTGLDPVSRVELWALISRAAAEGAAVCTTTTYLDEAERAGRVAVLHEGRVALHGSPESLLAEAPGAFWAGNGEGASRSWRRGRESRHWAPTLPVGASPVQPDLHDVVVAKLAAAGAPVSPVVERATEIGSAALVRVGGLSKRYGSLTAVDGVSLEVRPGEIVGLLGANGAGKTTLMRCLLGILAPSGGVAELFGEAPSRGTRARIGYVPQGMGLYRDLTVRQNAEFSAGVYGVAAPELRDARLVAEVPLGEQRRVAFEIALAHSPEVLILDEPTSGVAVTEAARLWAAVGAQAQRGVGVLVTTHNMAEAAQCDRLLLLVDGRVAAAGTMADVLDGAEVVSVECEDWERAFAVLTAAGLKVSLDGRAVRVLTADEAVVGAALVGLSARVSTVPASLDERMALL